MCSFVTAATVLCGCGIPEATEIVDKMSEKSIESVTVDINIDMDIDINADEEDIPNALGANITIQAENLNDVDNVVSSIIGDMDVYLLDGQYQASQDVEVYFVGENEQAIFFYDEDEELYYLIPNGLEEKVDLESLKKINTTITKQLRDATVGDKPVMVDGEKCYELVFCPEGKDSVAMLDTLMSSIGYEEEWSTYISTIEKKYEIDIKDIIEDLELTYTLYTSVETSYPYKLLINSGEDSANSFEVSIVFTDINSTKVDTPEEIEDIDSVAIVSEGVNRNPEEGAYNEKTHRFALYDADGYRICEFEVPKEFSLAYESEDKTSVAFSYLKDIHSKETYTTLNFSTNEPDFYKPFFLTGKEPAEQLYPNYKMESEEYEVNGLTIYKVHTSYDNSTMAGEKRDFYGVVVPYLDIKGEKDVFVIGFSEYFYNSWDHETGELIYALFQYSIDNKADSLVEKHDIVE